MIMDDLEIFRKLAQCEDKEQMQRCIDEYNESHKLTFTNADLIRAMSNEELADYLSKTFCHGYGKPQLVEWLKQPADGGH